MKQKSKLFLLVLLAGVLTLSACTGKKEKTQENTKATAKKGTFTVTDIKGRQVHFNKVPEKVVTIGHGALKYYTYVCGDKNLVGIEETEKKGHSVKGQSIHHAYPNLKNDSIHFFFALSFLVPASTLSAFFLFSNNSL